MIEKKQRGSQVEVMKNMKWIVYSRIVLGVLLLFGMGHVAKAEGMGYSVRAVIPDNQVDKSQTYFDLEMAPGGTQDLVLEIVSTSDQTLELMVEPHVATTNQNGELEYSVTPKTQDSSLLYPITDLLSGKQSVTVPPKETKQVTFRLTMPKELVKGKLVGGFSVYDKANEEDSMSTGKDEVQINNIFSVVIGIQLREQEAMIQPNLKLNGIKAGLFNYRTAVLVNLQNPQPDFLGDVSIIARVKKKGSKKVLYEAEKKQIAFAPNSNFDFPVTLENQELEPGSYELILEAQSDQEKWAFTKSFRITKEEAKEFNQEAVELVTPPKNNHLIVSISLIGLFVVILVVTVGYLIDQYKGRRKRA